MLFGDFNSLLRDLPRSLIEFCVTCNQFHPQFYDSQHFSRDVGAEKTAQY